MVPINCILLYTLVSMSEPKGSSGKGYDFFYPYIVKLLTVGTMLIALIDLDSVRRAELIDHCPWLNWPLGVNTTETELNNPVNTLKTQLTLEAQTAEEELELVVCT